MKPEEDEAAASEDKEGTPLNSAAAEGAVDDETPEKRESEEVKGTTEAPQAEEEEPEVPAEEDDVLILEEDGEFLNGSPPPLSPMAPSFPQPQVSMERAELNPAKGPKKAAAPAAKKQASNTYSAFQEMLEQCTGCFAVPVNHNR
eukprot:scaffold1617_cov252-Pinguiococcus_pyrenoidosus.AAC.6